MSVERQIYFDNINTTIPDNDVVEAACHALKSRAGNPSSHIHAAGIAAGQILDEARAKIGALIGAGADTIVFTSGATESNNLAISGFLKANPGCQLAVSTIEHFSILNQARKIEKEDVRVAIIDVDSFGKVDLSQLENFIQTGPTLVSIAYANPEIGTIQDITEIGRLCHQYDAVLHSDVTAAAAILDIDVAAMGIDMLTLSGHNMYAPMGIGALYTDKKIRIAPIFDGGNQQWGIRPGTENLSGAAAMGKACEIIKDGKAHWRGNLQQLGSALWQGLAEKVPFIHFTGHPDDRLPGHVSFWVEHVEGESLLLLLNMKGVMAASGSACSSNLKGMDEEDLVASHVLTAVGVPTDICAGSITFSLGRYNTRDEVDYVISIVPGIVEKLLAMSPSYSDYLKNKGVVK